jgi:hypothetical protein
MRKRPLTFLSLPRVRTLTGKEIELDIDRDFKVRALIPFHIAVV